MLYLGRNWSETRLNDIRALIGGRVQTMVDVGCAGGELTFALADMADKVIAVEPWAERAERAVAANPHDHVEIRNTTAEALPEGCADLVTCLEVIEHMPPEEAPAFLRGIRRLLRPGGRLLLTTPNRHSFQRRLGLPRLRGRSAYPNYPYPATPGEDDYHWYEYDCQELQTLLTDAGFQVSRHRGDHISVHRIRGLGRMSFILGSRHAGAWLPSLAKHHIVEALAAPQQAAAATPSNRIALGRTENRAGAIPGTSPSASSHTGPPPPSGDASSTRPR